MRYLILTLGALPYFGFAALDAWMHEKHRAVPRIEQWLHAGIALGIGGFVLFAFRSDFTYAASFLVVGLMFLSIDELGFHKHLSTTERRLHAAGDAALLVFVGVWLWTEFQL